MKRINDISEENYNHLCFVDEGTLFNIVENSTPLNECEAEDCISRALTQEVLTKAIEYKENPYQIFKRIEHCLSQK